MMVCRSCGAAIIWGRTANGKIMPLDREPDQERGNIVLKAGGGCRVLTRDQAIEAMEKGTTLYVSIAVDDCRNRSRTMTGVMAAQDNCLIALIDGRRITRAMLQACPPWRARMMALLAERLGVELEVSHEEVLAEAIRVGGDGTLWITQTFGG